MVPVYWAVAVTNAKENYHEYKIHHGYPEQKKSTVLGSGRFKVEPTGDTPQEKADSKKQRDKWIDQLGAVRALVNAAGGEFTDNTGRTDIEQIEYDEAKEQAEAARLARLKADEGKPTP